MPSDIPKSFLVSSSLQFTAEIVGITACFFYLNSTTTNTIFNLYNDISIGVIGVFVVISAIILIAWLIGQGTENPLAKSEKYSKVIKLFQMLGMLSLLTVVGYACFFGFSNKLDIAFHAGNLLYFKLAILAIALFGLFYNSNQIHIESKVGAISNNAAMFFIVCNVLLSLGLVAFLGLTSFDVIHIHTPKTLFLVTAIYCGVMAIVSFINALLTSHFLRNLRKACGGTDSPFSWVQEEEPNILRLQRIHFRSMRTQAMSILSFTLFGTGIGLMMSNNSFVHFASICILLAGFIMQLSSTTIGNKPEYDTNELVAKKFKVY